MSDGERSFAVRLRARVGSWRVVGVVGAIYFASQAAIGSILHDVGPLRVLRLQTTLSVEQFDAILGQLRDEHLMDAYKSHFYLDFVHPVWYALGLAALLAKALDANDVSPRWSSVLFVPFFAGGCDVVENLVHVYFLSTGMPPSAGLVVLGGLAASCKWALVSLLLGVALVLGVRGAFRSRSGDVGPPGGSEGAPS